MDYDSLRYPHPSLIMPADISTKTFVPLYSQLARLLEKKIDENAYPPGSRLPTEGALATEHDVSVITVRGALKVLIEKGRVERFPGKGTFVLEKRPIHAAWGLGSISDIDVTTIQSEFIPLAAGKVVPPDWVREALGHEEGVQLPWMRNVRAVKQERFMVSDVYHRREFGTLVRSNRFRKLVQQRKLVVMALCELEGIMLGEIRQSLSAALANEDIANALLINSGQPLLVMERLFIATDGRVIQVGKTHYRVDHYRYNLNLRPIEEHRTVTSSARRRLLDEGAANQVLAGT